MNQNKDGTQGDGFFIAMMLISTFIMLVCVFLPNRTSRSHVRPLDTHGEILQSIKEVTQNYQSLNRQLIENGAKIKDIQRKVDDIGATKDAKK